MKLVNKAYERAVVSMCQKLGDSGVPAELLFNDGYYHFGIHYYDGWRDCFSSQSIREIFEFVSEVERYSH